MNLLKLQMSAVALAFASASAAAAPTVIEATAFTFSNPDSTVADVLVSDADGATTIRFSDFASSMAVKSSDADGNAYSGDLNFAVRSGYHITGYSFSATFAGTLDAAVAPGGQAGTASNRGSVSLLASAPSGWSTGGNRQASQLNGNDAFVFSAANLSLRESMSMSLNGSMTVFAMPASWTTPDGVVHSQDSWAGLALLNPTLTVYTSAVPEPETYAMLALGLAVIGLTRRTRRLQEGTAQA
ncbi:PEP-CTERM sorting domain-containing protein [Massilia atriviolacea]|uniref:PEP-CTERM sorting domain-containing protein n=1 Tax=Massilia atriviolacea TaxID=2495579 RepID=A0A430HM25_9BURK|nr:PEP-CTERM sorting domain-containing protein [Massilia atriviolacea]RSZ58585.1 PEP-CTERM sorting domain-containing protein [Massilia atriviolacea]